MIYDILVLGHLVSLVLVEASYGKHIYAYGSPCSPCMIWNWICKGTPSTTFRRYSSVRLRNISRANGGRESNSRPLRLNDTPAFTCSLIGKKAAMTRSSSKICYICKQMYHLNPRATYRSSVYVLCGVLRSVMAANQDYLSPLAVQVLADKDGVLKLYEPKPSETTIAMREQRMHYVRKYEAETTWLYETAFRKLDVVFSSNMMVIVFVFLMVCLFEIWCGTLTSQIS